MDGSGNKIMKNNNNHYIRDNSTKTLSTFALLLILILFGCNQESEITSPVDTGPDHQYKLIQLPAPKSGLQIETEYTVYKWIEGEEGGRFNASYSYQSNSGQVDQYSNLRFYPRAFSYDEKRISQTFNTEGAAMKFGPSMQFGGIVELSYTIYGIDVSNLDPNTLDFVYIDANGNMVPVNYEYVTMDVNTGTLKVKNAELPHFSRYGFVN